MLFIGGILPRIPTPVKAAHFADLEMSGSADWQMSKDLGPGFGWTSPHKRRNAQSTMAGPGFVDTDVVECPCSSPCTRLARPSSRTLEYRIYWLHESTGRPTASFPGESISARLEVEHQLPHICVPIKKSRCNSKVTWRKDVLILTKFLYRRSFMSYFMITWRSPSMV